MASASNGRSVEDVSLPEPSSSSPRVAFPLSVPFLLSVLDNLDEAVTVYCPRFPPLVRERLSSSSPSSDIDSGRTSSAEHGDVPPGPAGDIVYENRQAKEFREMGSAAPCLRTLEKEFDFQHESGGSDPQRFQLVVRMDPRQSSLLRQVFQVMPDITFAADPRTASVTFISEKWARMTGIEASQASLQFEWARRLHPDDAAGMILAWRQSVMARLPFEKEFRLLKAEEDPAASASDAPGSSASDSKYLWIRSRSGYLMNEAGEPVMVVGTSTDVSDLVRTRELLAREKSFLITSLDSVPVGVIIAKREGNRCPVVFTNKETRKVWRYTMEALPEDALSFKDAVAYHEDGSRVQPHEWPLTRSIMAGEVVEGEQYDYERGDGTRGIVRFRSAPVRDPGTGDIVGGVVSSEDITEMLQVQQDKAARSSAEQAAAQMQMMLANVSHEVRTPIAGVIGLASLLSDTELDPEQKELVDGIKESGKLLLVVISDLLDHSKIKAGKMALEKKPFCLFAAIKHVISLTSEVTRTKGLQLVTHMDPNLPAAIVHSDLRLKQVFLNLLSNATKFTPYGGTITIEGYAEICCTGHENATPGDDAAIDEEDEAFDTLIAASPDEGSSMGSDEALSLRRPMMTATLPRRRRNLKGKRRGTKTPKPSVSSVAGASSGAGSRLRSQSAGSADTFVSARSSPLGASAGGATAFKVLAPPPGLKPLQLLPPPKAADAELPVLTIVGKAPKKDERWTPETKPQKPKSKSALLGKGMSPALQPVHTVSASPLNDVAAEVEAAGPPLAPAEGQPTQPHEAASLPLPSSGTWPDPSAATKRLAEPPVPGTWVKLKFSIADTGIGLTEPQMQRLFKPFVQADASTTRKYGGTGLGLALCHDLLKLMGGNITVESAGEGQGSCFRFEFMAQAADPATVECPLANERAPFRAFDDGESAVEAISEAEPTQIASPGGGRLLGNTRSTASAAVQSPKAWPLGQLKISPDRQSKQPGQPPQPAQPDQQGIAAQVAQADKAHLLQPAKPLQAGQPMQPGGQTQQLPMRPMLQIPSSGKQQAPPLPSATVAAAAACCAQQLTELRPSSPRTLGLSIGLEQTGSLLTASSARTCAAVLPTDVPSHGPSFTFKHNLSGGSDQSLPLPPQMQVQETATAPIQPPITTAPLLAPSSAVPAILGAVAGVAQSAATAPGLTAGVPPPAPAPSAPADPVVAAGARSEAVGIRPHRILVVDDNGVNRSLACRYLKKLNITNVDTANDGLEAVEAVKASSSPSSAEGDRKGYFDVVLMDLMMPIMSGVEATHGIKALPDRRKAGLPIVALTAASSAERLKYEDLFDGYLEKPYTLKELGDALERAFSKRRAASV